MNSGILLGDLAKKIGGELVGDPGIVIKGVGSANSAREGEVTLALNKKYLDMALDSDCSAIILSEELYRSTDMDRPVIICEMPKLAFARALSLFQNEPWGFRGIHPTALVSEGTELAPDVTLGPYCVIGPDCKIGKGCIIGPGAYVGRGVTMGEGSRIGANTYIDDGVTIGKRVTIESMSVIGNAGYGFVSTPEGHVRVPHNGTVIIEDDVEIGAQVTVDRGTTGPTVIGTGSKIDNQCYVAHNVRIGKHCIMAGQTGIGGSTVIGDRVIIAGRVGVIDHVNVGDDAIIYAGSVVTSNVPAGAGYSGNPARPHRDQLRILASMRHLPNIVKDYKKI